MAAPKLRKYVLDTNCFIDAARDADRRAAFETFCSRAAPGLHLSAVVAAELRAGAGRSLPTLERRVLGPYIRRGRLVTPTAASREALGTTLAAFVARDGLEIGR